MAAYNLNRDLGYCFIFIPLQTGVALICAIVFIMSFLNIFALFTGNISLQTNGYDTTFYYLPSTVGATGIVFAAIGLAGVYDDRHEWLRTFNFFLGAKILVSVVAMIADIMTLRRCDKNGLSSLQNNPQMYVLAAMGVCKWALWSYVLGCVIDLSIQCYFLYCTVIYRVALSMRLPYAIQFGGDVDQYDVTEKWRRYHVRQPWWVDYESPDVQKSIALQESLEDAEENVQGEDEILVPPPAVKGLVGYGYYGAAVPKEKTDEV